MQSTYRLTDSLFETELDRYLHDEMTDEQEERFLRACESNPTYEKKVTYALYLRNLPLHEVSHRYEQPLEKGFVFDDEDEKRRAKEEIEEAIQDGCFDLAKELCTAALELWPYDSGFEQLLGRAATAGQIDKSSGPRSEILLMFGKEVFERFTLPEAKDQEIEYEIPNPCDVSLAYESGTVIWSAGLSPETLFIYDQSSTRSGKASDDKDAPETEEGTPSFEKELLGGRIVVRIYKGRVSGKLRIRLKSSE